MKASSTHPAPGPEPAGSTTRPRATISYVEPDDPWIRRAFMAILEAMLGRLRIERLYQDIKAGEPDPARFFGAALDHAGIRVEYDGHPLDAVPRDTPLVLVANHPFGIIDGLVLCHTALALRGDFRILLHALLCQDPDLERYFLPVDFSGDKSALQRNIGTKRNALAALKANTTVALFPGGGVATAWKRLGFGPVEEFPWTTFAAKLARESGASVLPLHFHGRNSRLFQLASNVAEPLRLSLLIHEALNKFGSTIRVTVGPPVSAAELAAAGNRRQATDHLLSRVMALAPAQPREHPWRDPAHRRERARGG